MRNHADTWEAVSLNGRFVLLFALYATAFLALAQLLSLAWLNSFTAGVAARFWGLFAGPVAQSGPYLTLFAFPMEITHECTALHYLAIFSAGVVAHPAYSRAYRGVGIAAGVAVVFSMNIIRIGVLGMVGNYARNLFDLVHAYLLQGVFAVAVFVTWYLWVARSVRITRKTAKAVGLSVLAGLCALGLMLLAIDDYARCIAAATNGLLHIVGAGASAGLEVASRGRVVLLRTAGGILHVDLFFEVFNGIIVAALVGGSLPFNQGATAAQRGALAVGLLCVQHSATLAAYAVAFASGLDQPSLITVMWTVRGFGIAAPFLFWFVVCKAIPGHVVNER
ncbi:MAG: archaeosortase/exosortase family protein [Nitrospiraceae bacterium]|nr:archaeosortase/exosortase family protein [Nitrospiraceae bacterium]